MCRLLGCLRKKLQILELTHNPNSSLVRQVYSSKIQNFMNLAGYCFSAWIKDKKTPQTPLLYHSNTMLMYDNTYISLVRKTYHLELFYWIVRQLCFSVRKKNQKIVKNNAIIRPATKKNIEVKHNTKVKIQTRKNIFANIENLEKLFFFRKFDGYQIRKFLGMATVVSAKKDSSLIETKKKSDALYILIRGVVMVYSKAPESITYSKVGLMMSGESFGYFCLLTGDLPSETCITCEDSIFMKLKTETLIKLKSTRKNNHLQFLNLFLSEISYIEKKTISKLKYFTQLKKLIK